MLFLYIREKLIKRRNKNNYNNNNKNKLKDIIQGIAEPNLEVLPFASYSKGLV